jgi:hypothetical protein
MRISPLLAAALTAALLAACAPIMSKQEVGTTVGFAPDPDLVGTWEVQDPVRDNVDMRLRVQIVAEPDGTMHLIANYPDGKSDESVLHVVRLGDNRYLNVAPDGPANPEPSADDPPPVAFPSYYGAYSNGRLALYDAAREPTLGAIHSGALKGTVNPGSGDITITSEPADLDTFMATPQSAELFTQPSLILKRVD